MLIALYKDIWLYSYALVFYHPLSVTFNTSSHRHKYTSLSRYHFLGSTISHVTDRYASESWTLDELWISFHCLLTCVNLIKYNILSNVISPMSYSLSSLSLGRILVHWELSRVSFKVSYDFRCLLFCYGINILRLSTSSRRKGYMCLFYVCLHGRCNNIKFPSTIGESPNYP